MPKGPNVHSVVDETWKSGHGKSSGHDNFTTQTVPFPFGTPNDPDWLEVAYCQTCMALQPYQNG